ncbi:MAG: hypothetical protein JSU86_16000 [Phycisphaerales bacterium]|nr:MAG: hypothetical protein JSU86_16000 [Phycisphaerales bacterium]
MTRGSLDSSAHRDFIERLCGLYSEAQVTEQLNLPHNRVDLGTAEPVALHYSGKQTLVIGKHQSAVRLSDERANMCPNYWHFSPYGFCPFDCAYCYLAATPGVRFSPTVKIFVNVSEMLDDIDRIARRLAQPTAFYLGKLQDGLALDQLTGYSRVMVPFFASHPYARLVVLTKASDVRNLMEVEHSGNTILSWSLNPPEVCGQFEINTPAPGERIEAMRHCAAAGYPVRAVIMPIIPIARWRDVYGMFLQELITTVPLARITLGGICSYDGALSLTDFKLGPGNTVSRALHRCGFKSADGRRRYVVSERIEMYRHLITAIRRLDPQRPIALCLEERAVFEALGMMGNAGHCNCVL